MSQPTSTVKKDHSFTIFLTILCIAISIMTICFFVERYQMKKAKEAELKHLVMFVKLEDDLESCSNKSQNLDIRLASFDLLLQHKIHQDVPVQDLKTMLQKCESTILAS